MTTESLPVAPRTRRAVTLIILLHFFAILTAVTSASGPGFPAPVLAVLANKPLRPYLELTFLGSAYRFFAPNPGATNVLWFRVQYLDGTVRWLELPRRQDFGTRTAYQRHLSVAMILNQYLAPPDEAGRQQLNEIGQICLASYVRHVARTIPRSGADGRPIAVRSVGVYDAFHALLTPEQIRAGRVPADLQNYKALFLGAFKPDGTRTDPFRPGTQDKPISYVAAGILAVDLYPLVKRQPAADPRQLADDLALPEPIRHLLSRYPELLDPQAADRDLQGRIEVLMSGPTAGPGGKT